MYPCTIVFCSGTFEILLTGYHLILSRHHQIFMDIYFFSNVFQKMKDQNCDLYVDMEVKAGFLSFRKTVS